MKSTRVDKGGQKLFSPLGKLKPDLGPGAMVCLYPQVLPIDDENMSAPVGLAAGK